MTTAREIWEAVEIECRKQKTQPLSLETFNYFINKVILMWYDNVYRAYELNQKMTDNLRVFLSTSKLEVKKSDFYDAESYKGIYECNLPLDYMHLISCSCNFAVTKSKGCLYAGKKIKQPAIRLTNDIESQIETDYYLRPSIKRPYFIIRNVNTSNDIPTNPFSGEDGYEDTLTKDSSGTDVSTTKLPRMIKIGGEKESQVEKKSGNRYGNTSPIRMEIRYGNDEKYCELESVYITYIKYPQYINLTQKQFDIIEDTSQIIELPGHVIQEIVNNLTSIILENIGDQRLSTNIQVNSNIQSGIPVGAITIDRQSSK